MNPRIRQFDLVQHLADVGRRQRRMRKKLYEFVERAFEVDVVLPQGVVGIDDQVLAHGWQVGPSLSDWMMTGTNLTRTHRHAASSLTID